MTLHLRTTIAPMGPAGAIVLTEDETLALGGGKKAPVTVTIGEVTERLRLASMGGQYLIGLRREVRETFGLQLGDVVDAVIALDDAPREVTVPGDLAEALAAAGLTEAFAALAYTHRKEHITAVEGAKRAETRTRRIAACVEALSG